MLDPVRTSVLTGNCPRRMLPGEGYPGNKFGLPRRNIAPLMVARAVPPPPYTARTFRRTSADWAKRTAAEPEIAPQRNLADVIALGGGVPIDASGETIGGVGVSGAPGQDKDEACAKAGVAKVADQLK